jgi:hypothetical protein
MDTLTAGMPFGIMLNLKEKPDPNRLSAEMPYALFKAIYRSG